VRQHEQASRCVAANLGHEPMVMPKRYRDNPCTQCAGSPPLIACSRLKCVESSTGLGHNQGTNHFRRAMESVSD
jgi:hypothetical protein